MEAWEEYKNRRRETKKAVINAKKSVDERWSKKLVESFRENNKMFWKEVNRAKRKKEDVSVEVKNREGVLIQEMSVREVEGTF